VPGTWPYNGVTADAAAGGSERMATRIQSEGLLGRTVESAQLTSR
jgi:hypothetical protein